MALLLAALLLSSSVLGAPAAHGRPGKAVVLNTWPFVNATIKAYSVLRQTDDVLRAVELGVSTCETEQCDHTVGYGGSPDEIGQTTLDAMIMNGDTIEVGSAVNLHQTKSAISAARLVMERTNHTMLAGRDADAFAEMMGLPQSTLITNFSRSLWSQWKANSCQPNYRRNVSIGNRKALRDQCVREALAQEWQES